MELKHVVKIEVFFTDESKCIIDALLMYKAKIDMNRNKLSFVLVEETDDYKRLIANTKRKNMREQDRAPLEAMDKINRALFNFKTIEKVYIHIFEKNYSYEFRIEGVLFFEKNNGVIRLQSIKH